MTGSHLNFSLLNLFHRCLDFLLYNCMHLCQFYMKVHEERKQYAHAHSSAFVLNKMLLLKLHNVILCTHLYEFLRTFALIVCSILTAHVIHVAVSCHVMSRARALSKKYLANKKSQNRNLFCDKARKEVMRALEK